jgi:hypothetical protein
MPRSANSSKKQKSERRKLATYLAARNSHRFERRRASPHQAAEWRTRLVIIALLLAAIGLWGIWREFFQ